MQVRIIKADGYLSGWFARLCKGDGDFQIAWVDQHWCRLVSLSISVSSIQHTLRSLCTLEVSLSQQVRLTVLGVGVSHWLIEWGNIVWLYYLLYVCIRYCCFYLLHFLFSVERQISMLLIDSKESVFVSVSHLPREQTTVVRNRRCIYHKNAALSADDSKYHCHMAACCTYHLACE